MEIKWYWPAEQMGLVQNTSHLYNDGNIYYEVAAKTDEVFMTLTVLLIPAVLLLGFLIRFFVRQSRRGQKLLRFGTGFLLLYALLSAVGIGPYLVLYPQGGGFLDMELIEHLAQGIYCALLALSLFWGGRLGHFFSCRHRAEKR